MKFRRIGGWKKEKIVAISVILAGNLLGIGFLLAEQKKQSTFYLERNAFGEGSYEETLNVKIGEKEQKIKVLVEEQQYTEQQKKEYFQNAKTELDRWLQERKDASGKLLEDLEFPKEIGNNPVRLSWNTDRPEVVDWEGKIGNIQNNTGEEVELMCSVFLADETEIWQKLIRVYPKKPDEKEALEQNIREETEKINDKFSKKLYLPQNINGVSLSYQKERSDKGLLVCICSFLLGLGIFPLKKEKEKQAKEKRMKEMQLDYPDIIEKMVLFLQAGFSIRKAMEKLASNYVKNREKYHAKEHAAYEELVRTCKEMEGGIYEADAYERMGKRCGLSEYKIFSVLLIQNLKKGNQSILELLKREAVTAQDERRRRAKVRGEEASTKLLLPMILQLIVVMIILMVPAFLSFI